MQQALTAWILAAMTLAWTLTSKLVGPTPSDIAAAIATASIEKPLFSGGDGARQGAALMVAISRFESGNRQVPGDCHGLKPGDARCGKLDAEHAPTSFCFMQVHLPNGAKTAEGWTGAELLADPLKCARAAREIIRRSIKASPADVPLLQYAGTRRLAGQRFDLAKRLFREVPFAADGS